MVTKITNGVKVSVETFYQKDFSNPMREEYVFAYRVTIYNESDSSVQLLRRHWHIYDSIGDDREVKGEGVVGKQPVIEPKAYHQYISGCHLKTPIGKMHGIYQMTRINTGEEFEVKIPEFQLIAPLVLN